MNLMESWGRLLKLAYKWGTLPVVLLLFFSGQGWDAVRVAHGYAQTTGVVTHYSCRKTVVVQYSYTVAGVPHQGSSTRALSSFECPQYTPGETVTVFYSIQQPDLALMNTTPQQALLHQLGVIFAVLLMVPFVTLMLAYKESES